MQAGSKSVAAQRRQIHIFWAGAVYYFDLFLFPEVTSAVTRIPLGEYSVFSGRSGLFGSLFVGMTAAYFLKRLFFRL